MDRWQNALKVKMSLMISISGLLLSCQNGTVTLNGLDIKIDGISFDDRYKNFKTSNLQQFEIEGFCSRDLSSVYYRFDSNSQWTSIDSQNGEFSCPSTGTFKLRFNQSLSTLKASSGYSPANFGRESQLTIEFYGKTNEYLSKNISLIVSQFAEKGKTQVSTSPEARLNSSSFKIVGRLSKYQQSHPSVSSTGFTIRQGSLRLSR